jgi:hypothetical protein
MLLQKSVAITNGCEIINNGKSYSIAQKKDGLQFFVFICFLLSQGYVVPVLLVTSNWALWPSLVDICFAVFIIITIFRARNNRTDANICYLQKAMIAYILVSVISFVVITIYSSDSGRGINFGGYQLYSLCKFYLMLWAAGKMPIDGVRLKIINRVLFVLALWVCGVVILRYYVVDVDFYQTIKDPLVAGPWAYSNRNIITSILGYNHGFTAAQILLIIALCIQTGFNKQKLNLFEMLLLAMGVVSCFLTQSRAGFVSFVIFAIIMMVEKSLKIAVFVAMTFVLIGIMSHAPIVQYDGDVIINRQMWFTSSNIDVSVLSGRDQIWKDKIQLMQEQPLILLFGSGFGMAAEGNVNAHMLILHMIIELGLIGTAIIAIRSFGVMKILFRYRERLKPMLACTIALLISTLSQETFYPVPAFGWFIGLFIVSLRVALSEIECGKR